ncbi:MAG: hypothetical protein JRF41_04630 [Deltaproteobacteria bacterium]|nr:hypothetical protein [Deltaproteobacteria bacterium]MBW2053345.1 hypothetical protein [Deltaproteobacteria bacterium]MBW2322797.1 hypothetical protein [Deltaproteobacteria bacterium]
MRGISIENITEGIPNMAALAGEIKTVSIASYYPVAGKSRDAALLAAKMNGLYNLKVIPPCGDGSL